MHSSKASLPVVKEESAFAVKLLEGTCTNSFQPLFMTKMPFIRQYDHIICFRDLRGIQKVARKLCSSQELNDNSGYVFPLVVSLFQKLFEKGLKSRVSQMNFSLIPPSVSHISAKFNPLNVKDFLMVGLKLNPESAFNLVERGPEANLPEAAEFREFWKGKSEVRRFRDGSICEAVVWGEEGAAIYKRRLIVSYIVKFLMKHHLQLSNDMYLYIADNLEFVLNKEENFPSNVEEKSQEVHKVFDELSHQLKELKDLPLDVAGVRCTSPVYRFTDICPPLPVSYSQKMYKSFANKTPLGYNIKENIMEVPPYVSPIDIIIKLSVSKKWPSDIKAARRLVAAFNICIARALREQHSVEVQVTPENILVLKKGYVFRIYLSYDKEIALIKKQVSAEGVTFYRDTPLSIALEKQFFNLPKLTGALYGLSQQYLAFGKAASLAKYWMGCQLLDDYHFPHVVIDVLMAWTFISPEPYSPVSQPLPAFLRFLSVLATTNWYTEPVIVNFNELLSRQQISEIEKHFSSNRSTLPPLFVATPYDLSGTLWTKEVPTLPTLTRIAKLASTTLKLLEVYLIADPSPSNLKSVFVAPHSGYDIVVHIKPSMVRKNKFPKKMQEIVCEEKFPKLSVYDFDPVERYVSELRGNYCHIGLFFYNPYKPTEVGILLKPGTSELKNFKVANVNGRVPVVKNGSAFLQCQVKSLVDDIKLLGTGIIHSVVINHS